MSLQTHRDVLVPLVSPPWGDRQGMDRKTVHAWEKDTLAAFCGKKISVSAKSRIMSGHRWFPYPAINLLQYLYHTYRHIFSFLLHLWRWLVTTRNILFSFVLALLNFSYCPMYFCFLFFFFKYNSYSLQKLVFLIQILWKKNMLDVLVGLVCSCQETS